MTAAARDNEASEQNTCGREVLVTIRLAGRDRPAFVDVNRGTCPARAGHPPPCVVAVDEADVDLVLETMRS